MNTGRLIYRLQRGPVTIVSTIWNRLKMRMLGIKFGKHFTTCGSVHFRNLGGKISIGDYCHFNSSFISSGIGGQTKSSLIVGNQGSIKIGNNVSLSNTTIVSHESIIIKDYSCIGAGVKIWDTDFHSVNSEYRLNGNTHINTRPVVIGEKCFIGGNSIILKGVIIGAKSVVAAGSVVTKDIPANEIWGGNPAKFIKKIENNI